MLNTSGFLLFTKQEDADAAMRLNGAVVGGSPIRVEKPRGAPANRNRRLLLTSLPSRGKKSLLVAIRRAFPGVMHDSDVHFTTING
jgi:hypothetical protein